jgi:hypothetical protein
MGDDKLIATKGEIAKELNCCIKTLEKRHKSRPLPLLPGMAQWQVWKSDLIRWSKGGNN